MLKYFLDSMVHETAKRNLW